MSKRSQESSSPGSPTSKAQASGLVSRHGVSVGQDYSSIPKSPGSTRDSQVWTWEESSKSVWYSVQHASGNREYGSEDSGEVSQRVHAKKTCENKKDRLRHDESISELSVNSEKMHTSTWTRFMASSMQAALHMDPSCEKNMEIFKNCQFENIKGLFGLTRLMIEGNSEIKNVFPADVASSLQEKPVLLKEQTTKWTNARVFVCSDSVLCLGKMHGPEDAMKRWSDQVSTLKMCHTFRELEGLDGEPIDFEWTISQEPQRWTFSMKFRQICKESTSHLKTSVIEESSCQCSTTLFWTKEEMKILVLLRQGRSKSMPQILMMDTGHSWDPERESKWYQGYATNWSGKWDLRASQTVEDFENSGHPVFQGESTGSWNTQEEKRIETPSTSMENIAILTYQTGLFMPRTSSVSTEQSQKWCGTNSGEASQSRPESARKTSPEIQIKQEDFKSLIDIPRLPHASGNRMLQILKDFNSMPFMSKIEYLRTTAKFYRPIEKGNYYVTTTLEDDGWGKRTSMCKEYTAPSNQEDPRPYASIAADQ